ncbi:MAG TPA: glycoside hydrolase family 104 protein [Burkholderiaceae bacterium]|nr:glycoside hydrolase family 104 protein [Burkholderiaceae bacterium]
MGARLFLWSALGALIAWRLAPRALAEFDAASSGEALQLASLPELIGGAVSDPAGALGLELELEPELGQADANARAFLAAIAWAEGADYSTLYGGALFDSFADHPAELGWAGLRLPDRLCQAAGFGPGCVSTAAGRYQINRPTWRALRARLALPDFSPASQDAAALELIRERGALGLVHAGEFAAAVDRVRRVWASLPGAGYAQPEKSLDALASVYQFNGGTFA